MTDAAVLRARASAASLAPAQSSVALSRALGERLTGYHCFTPRHLSMGMSGDFEVAVEEGATLVRVGSAIFGAR
jgi:uncharacterized pyridoxal phosphate-containing UPF0001 family protein